MEPTIFLLNQNWTDIKPARIFKLHQNWFQEVPAIFRFKPCSSVVEPQPDHGTCTMIRIVLVFLVLELSGSLEPTTLSLNWSSYWNRSTFRSIRAELVFL
jgi:hypothetical protein